MAVRSSGTPATCPLSGGKTRVRTAALTRHRHPTGAVHRPASRLSMHLGTCATVGEKNITHVVSGSVLLHRVQNGHGCRGRADDDRSGSNACALTRIIQAGLGKRCCAHASHLRSQGDIEPRCPPRNPLRGVC
ncbi:hypothetical protein XCV0370 [Xanthomonas euvesicatoria pv. vesicatoria str. 85-10]|uniref:Uncharacterized protein n=1 Tax=Xanthomonas euvesicatoria pv. vesicatoria (strain 85-10) TaxID=316273 RepID=Q3BYR2_XANE5|nr:hypothetical protein XCV0370 [Xanthomonas euvesicatoria pv. vesicatoria str. 85-10]